MPRKKVLRSHTIIPQELYVERSADAQLRQIVMDMGRPGYILVARQMGKTNLLLNAKRVLENASDKFLYLDISNTFPDIQQFFRNIIDIAIDSLPEAFAAVGVDINKRRAANSLLLPHKEHELELRDILRAIDGRLVICLDEIDALIRTQYADHIFSFIRSIYFSGRINFPEFKRLTYVLSGVAEPAELIKNKDVSPFNIGEKIYLDDFSPEEFDQFIHKAQLPFDRVLIDRIYFWTSGNPRIVWDICSILEDISIKGLDLSTETVDQTVHDLYLVNYDLPPIDHIRTLVRDDSIIRDAIISIHYGKSELISDALRNRLYLAGITRPNYSKTKTLSIRNKILLESLSETWIQDIEKQKLSTLELADKKYVQSQYGEALALFEEYLSSTNTPVELDYLYYKIGHCHYNLKNYHEAVSSFDKTNFTKEEHSALYYSVQHFEGISCLFIGNYEKSAEFFREILKQNTNNTKLYNYYESCINLSSLLFLDYEKNRDEILLLNRRVIDSELRVREVETDSSEANSTLCAAHYNLSKANRKQGDIESALQCLDNAIRLATEQAQVTLLLESIVFVECLDKKKKLLEQCVHLVLDNSLVVSSHNKACPLDFSDEVCVRLVEQLEEFGDQNNLNMLFEHLSDKCFSHNAEAGEIATLAFYNALSKGNKKVALNLIERALNFTPDVQDESVRRQLMTFRMFLTPSNNLRSLWQDYYNEFLVQDDSFLMNADYRLLWNFVTNQILKKEFKSAESLINKARHLILNIEKDNMSDMIYSGKLVIDALDIELYFAQNIKDIALIKAESLIKLLNSLKTLSLTYFGDDALSELKIRVNNIITLLKSANNVERVAKKYGRNEIVKVKFSNGIALIGKFKKFQEQIKAGLCKIVND